MSAKAHPVVRALLFAAAALVAVASALALRSPIGAEGGVPIPAPAGTTWSIVAGYNTATHAPHDGNDPHAIDIVRVQRDQTAYTRVLSPVSGAVAWRDWDGLSITDANGFDHLLAHVAPLDHIKRGSVLSVGEHIATVCAAYDCGNTGPPHIHYAVHHSNGDGYLGPSVAFTGRYALEGTELPWSGEFNLHSGMEFTSTNAPGWTPPTTSATPDPEPEAESVSPTEPAWTIPADAPVGGWRLVGADRETSVAGLFNTLDAPLSELVVHHAVGNDFDRFDPYDPASAEIAVRRLSPGQAVWARVLYGVPWLPAPPAETQQVTLRLFRGANLISWQGPDRQIAAALRNVAHLSHAYRYDPYTGDWQFWSPDGPGFLDTLTELRSGDALYVVVRAGSVWTQLP